MSEIASPQGNLRPCRILYLIDGLEGDGAERQFCELVKGVFALEDYEPHVVLLEKNEGGHAWILEALGLPVNVFARKSRFDLSPIPRIARYIRDHDIDLVHAYMSMGSEFGLIAARLCRRPVITSSIRNGMNRDWREAVRTWYQSQFADLAVANSQAGFTSRFRKMRSHFRVVHNGLDSQRFGIDAENRCKVRHELGVGPDIRLICMAARMEPQKDHETLLEAFRIFRRHDDQTLLLLAGQGALEDTLREQARNLGVDKHVRFLGHRRDVERLLAASDVSVLLTCTDIHHEGISNTIIESMAAGTAVIATRGGGTDEILGDEDSGPPPYTFGIKVDPYNWSQVAEGLRYLLGDDTERERLANAAKSMVARRFGIQRFIDENVALYRELKPTLVTPRGAIAARHKL